MNSHWMYYYYHCNMETYENNQDYLKSSSKKLCMVAWTHWRILPHSRHYILEMILENHQSKSRQLPFHKVQNFWESGYFCLDKILSRDMIATSKYFEVLCCKGSDIFSHITLWSRRKNNAIASFGKISFVMIWVPSQQLHVFTKLLQ